MIKSILLIASLPESLINFRGDLLAKLVKDNVRVHVASPDLSQDIRESLERMEVVCHEIKLKRTGLNLLTDLVSIWSIISVIDRVEPDTILSYTIKPVIYGSLAGSLKRVATIGAMITGLGYAFGKHSGFKSLIISMVAKVFYRIALSRCTQVFFQNPDDLQLFVDKDLVKKSQAHLINGSGVNLDYFSKRPFQKSGQVEFLLIARLLRDKGIYEYVNAAKLLKEQGVSATFVIAGWFDTNPASIKESEIREWVEDGAVEFVGRLNDVRPALERCQVFILPSYREGTPRTVLEAMAVGRPIITSDAPGCRETVIDGDNGFLVPVGDFEVLAKKMKMFIDDSGLCRKMGDRSRLIAESKYDVNKVNKAVIDALNGGM